MGALTSLLIGIIVMSSVFVALGLIYTDVTYQYTTENSTLSSQFYAFNASVTSMNTHMQNIENALSSKDWDALSKLQEIAFIGLNIGGIIMGTPTTFIAFIGQITSFMPYVPPWVIALVGGSITIFIVLYAVSMVLGRDV